MKARLKVLSGSSAGKELKLKKGQFLIGRSDSCHLRPRSDAVSRKHCVLFIEDETIRIRDLKSRNGTLVNGEKAEGDVSVNSGDKIVVGPLEFEVLFSLDAPAAPKPVAAKSPAAEKAKSPAAPTKTAAKAGAGSSSAVADDDIFGWLEEGDEVDREERMTDPSTRQFKVDEATKGEEAATDTVDMAKADGKTSDTSIGKKAGKKGKKEKKEKKEVGKLPTVPEKSSENSQEAAADALKQFFKRS